MIVSVDICLFDFLRIIVFCFLFVLAEATQLRRVNKELEENLIRIEQRFNQLQKTLLSFEEGSISREQKQKNVFDFNFR